MATNVRASINSGVAVVDGAGYSGVRFLHIWVETGGAIALRNPRDGSPYVLSGIPGGQFFNVDANFIGDLAAGTTAAGLTVCGSGDVYVAPG